MFCFIVPNNLLADSTARVPDQEMLSLAKEYNRKEGGQSFLVMHQGKIIGEDYPNGGSKDKSLALASGTKSFNGIVALAAIEDGIITLNEKVCDSLTEWKKDPLKSQITYQQLLTLTSGLEPGTHANTYKDTWKNVIKAPMKGKPGEQFQYGPNHLNTFGEALQRYLLMFYGETYEQYLKRRILDPIGVKLEWKGRFADSNPQLAGGSAMTARDWAKFGEWVCNRGIINGTSIISSKLFDLLTVGTKANPAYGLTWWLQTVGSSSQKNDWLPKDFFMAAGAGNQRLYIIRSLELVIVRQAPISDKYHFDDKTFLSLLLKGKDEVETGFVPDDIEMGDPTLSYGDPEFEPFGTRVLFQDRVDNNSIWVDYLNPETGEFSTKDGKNILVDTGIAPLKESRQGPEWGVSKNGSAIFYSKKDDKGVMQIWRATLQGVKVSTQQLTYSNLNMYGVFASQSITSNSIKISCVQHTISNPTGSAVWFDENTPLEINILPNAYFWVKGLRFSSDANYVFYSYQSSSNPYEKGTSQIAMMDTTTKEIKILTNDPGNKDEAWPFIAPEYNYELCIATTINNEKIAIYRNNKNPSGFWSKVAEIKMPENSNYQYMYSMEPIQLTNKSITFSYFTIVAYLDNTGESSVPREDSSLWLFGLGNKLARRVDQPMHGHKLEPETWTSNLDVFYYYNFIDVDKNPNVGHLRRCKTGL